MCVMPSVCWFLVNVCMAFVNLNINICTLPSRKLLIVNLIFFSRELKVSCIYLTPCSFTKSKVSWIYLMYSFIRDLSNKSLTIVFPNSAMLFASTVQRGSHECSIDLPVVSNVKTECCFCKSVNNQLFHCLRVVVWITLSS